MATNDNNTPNNQSGTVDDDPNIFIIWLDEFIGKKDDYFLLKSAFFTTIDPTTSLVTSLRDEDINHSIQSNEAMAIAVDDVKLRFQAFDSVENCFNVVGNNGNKRIFLITSASKGKILLPALFEHFFEQMKKNSPLYIYCGNMNMIEVKDVDPINQWALEYIDYLCMENFAEDLLNRVVLDAGDYFLEKADLFLQEKSNYNARRYYQWAKQLFKRYERITKKTVTAKRIAKIEQNMIQIDKQLDEERGNEDRPSEPCS